MRLTLINQFYTPDISPTAHLCASLAEHRAARGDEVTVVAGRGGYLKTVDATEAGPVNVVRVWTARLGSVSVLRRLVDWVTFYFMATFRVLQLPGQDVIVALTTPPCIAWAGVLQKVLHPKTRLVLWNMDCYPEAVERTGFIRKGGALSRVMRAMNRALFRQLDCLICLDPAMAQLLMSQYAPGHRLDAKIIPNWERSALFPPDRTPPKWDDPLAETLRGKFVVLYLGNAGFGHEFRTILDVAERLKDERVVFLFVGGGALRPWIEDESRRRGLHNIVLHDYVPKEQTPAVIAGADCALITLENYAAGVMSPSKLHSNLAMRLPVLYIGPVGSNVDEAILRFECGISCRPGSASEATAFILALMQNPALHEDLRRKARLAFETAYCDDRTLPQFDDVFDELLGKKSALPTPVSAAVPGALR